MMPDQHPGLEELTLHALEPGAQDGRVRQHLAQCSECREAVAEMHADLALAAMALPQLTPPAAAKQRLFQAAGVKLPQTASTTAQSASAHGETSNVIPMRPRRHSPGVMWGGWLAAAACLLYAVSVRNANQGMRQRLLIETAELRQSNASAARAEKVLDVLSSPRAQRVTLVAAHTRPEPIGHAVYLADRGALVFTASNLAPLPANKTYELWVIPANGRAPVPAGTFKPDARGMASILLPSLPRGVNAKAFGVTMENAGGSSTPTLPILLAGG